jgi:hypothetical protein
VWNQANYIRCSINLKKGNTLRWTSFSNECVRILETEQEFESDVLLILLVRLRLIAEKLSDLQWSTPETTSHASVPAMFTLRSLESQLQDVKSKIPDTLLNNRERLPTSVKSQSHHERLTFMFRSSLGRASRLRIRHLRDWIISRIERIYKSP